MKKKKFNHLIRDVKSAEQEDLQLLEKLQEEYPYSQVIHAVAAKTHILLKSKQAQNKLGKAAMYSADRSILKFYIKGEASAPKNKEVITAPRQASSPPQVTRQNTEASSTLPAKKQVVVEVAPMVPSEHDLEMDKLRENIIKHALELKHNVENYKNSESEAEESFESSKNKELSSPPSAKLKKELPKEEKQEKETAPNAGDETEETLISDLTNIEEKNLGPKQSEQNKVIEAFIENNPKVSPPKEKPVTTDEETMDLARESVNFKDDLISENLAVIMAKQGKKNKAIDIYRKLIWKYPQKKAYFAGQIENIEKS